MNVKNKLKGKGFVCLVRSSDDEEGLSTKAQLLLLKKVGLAKGMVHVANEVLDGVTGSLPGRREDLQRLLRRKVDDNDFDVLLVQRCDRMTRGGSDHAFWFKFECKRVGITVIYGADDIPAGRYANLIEVAKHDAAQEAAISTSQRTAQGQQQALEDDRISASSHTPFGCYRLYTTADRTPLHIIRDLRNGLQQKLHHETRQVIDTYGAVGGRARGHYRKQKTERCFLVPGDVAEVAVVREMFQLRWVARLGGRRIAVMLNDRGIPAPMGGEWSQRQVESITEHETYTGCGVANRTTSAIYHCRNKGEPRPQEHDDQVLATASYIKVELRPEEEWVRRPEPHMRDFLPPDVKAAAVAGQDAVWKRRLNPDETKNRSHRHPDSLYLLSGLLVAKQDGQTLSTVLCGPPDHRVRYYRHRRARKAKTRSPYSNTFNASALERAVLDVFAEVVKDVPDLRARVTRFVAEQQAARAAAPTAGELERLRERCASIRKKVATILRVVDEATEDDAREEIGRLTRERQSVEQQIKVLEAQGDADVIDADAVVESVVHRAQNLMDHLEGLPPVALKDILVAFTERLVADMETREVEFAFYIPADVVFDADRAFSDLRPGTNSRSSTGSGTQMGLPLAIGTCRYVHGQRSVCFECRRHRPAA